MRNFFRGGWKQKELLAGKTPPEVLNQFQPAEKPAGQQQNL
jgi:hypothetical protein